MWYQRRGSKFGSKTQEFNGEVYHSKKEAGYAAELELRRKAKDIQSWDRQIRISLDVNGYHICNYIVDFQVTNMDGSIELHEVKGFETDVFRMKRKLLEATYLMQHPEVKYVVIK